MGEYEDGWEDALEAAEASITEGVRRQIMRLRGRPGPPDPPVRERPDRDPPDDDGDDWTPRSEERRERIMACPVRERPVPTPEDVQVVSRHSAIPGKWSVVGVEGDWGPIELGLWPNTIFVGLTPDAVIGPITQKPGTQHARSEFHNIGIRAAHDSFAFRQLAPLGRLVLKNFWFVDANQTSGLHLGKGWEFLHVEGYQHREGVKFLEHVLYIKGGGPTQIVRNDMRGAGRSFVQYRPHGAGTEPYPFDATPVPSGPLFVAENVSDGFGWDHAHIGGGAVITVWCTLEHPAVIRDNMITNCRTGGIMVGQGATNTHPPLTDDGYSHSMVWLEQNSVGVTGKDGSDPRHAVSVSATRELVLAGDNWFHSDHRYDLVLDAEFSWKQGAKPNGRIHALQRPDVDKIARWSPAEQEYLVL